MSEFVGKQKEECNIPEPEVVEEICPTCIPNPNAPKIEWLDQEEPYFDERICEYIIRAIGHKLQDAMVNGIRVSNKDTKQKSVSTFVVFDTLREYVDYFKEDHIRKLLRHFDKEVSDEAIALATVFENEIIVNSNSLINFKISIKAEAFNQLPSSKPKSEEEEKTSPAAAKNANLPEKLIIDDEENTLFSDLITCKLGIMAHEMKYSYYRQVNKGVITYDVEGQTKFFEPKHISESIDEFKGELDKLLRLNGMSFYSLSNIFITLDDTATKVEIELDNSNEDKPMAIKKVFATSGMCPRKELKKGLDNFIEKAYNPQAIYFMSNFSSAYSDITADQPKPWLEFFEEYVYPPILASISTPKETTLEPSGASCALDLDIGALAGDLLEDFLIGAWDIFSHDFDVDSCTDDPNKREPAIAQSINPKEQEQRELLYKEELKKLRKEREADLQRIYDEVDPDPDETDFAEDANEDVHDDDLLRQRVAEFENDLKEQAGINAENRLKKMDKEQFKHPFYDHFKSSMKERMEDDQSIISIFKKIQKEPGPSSEKTQKFISTIGLCGVTKGFKQALACLTKQIDLKVLVTSAVKTVLTPLGTSALSETLSALMSGLPADKQLEVELEIGKKFDNVKPPWDPSFGGDGGASQAANDSIMLLLEAYTEAILGVASPDHLIKEFRNRCPALAFIIDKINRENCPVPPEKDIVDKKIKKFNFDVCDPTLPVLNLKLPKFELKPNLFYQFKNNMKKAIREAIMKAISLMVDKLIKLLEEKLCQALSALGKMGLDALMGNPVDFGQILKDSFCPDAGPDEIADLGNKLLNNIGAKDNDIQSAFDCFTGAILGTMTQREMIDLITSPNKNPRDLRLFMETIKVGCPGMYDLVNSPSRASNFFDSIGNLIPADTRERLRSTPFLDDEVPIYDSICLTSAELNAWNQMRRNRLQNAGLSEQEAEEQVDRYNQRARRSLEDALDAINNGPERSLNDLIKGLLSPIDECELKEGESAFGNKLAREPKELVQIQDELSNRIFDNILDACEKKICGSGFGESLITNILSDTYGVNKNLHTFLTNFFFTSLSYHDREEDNEIKTEKANFIHKLFDMPEDIGYYPETVGMATKNQLMPESDYQSTVTVYPEITKTFYNADQELTTDIITQEQYEESSYKKNFSRTIQVTSLSSQEFKGEISFISRDLIGAGRNLDYKIKLQCPRLLINFSSLQKNESEDLISNMEPDGSVELRNNAFNQIIRNSLSELSYFPKILNEENYENTIGLVFNSVISGILEKSTGFSFGYEPEDIVEEDLIYVNPEADPNDDSTWEYTYSEEEKVLGKSATENPRVIFLDPGEHGGTYEVPPVYIKPKEMQGWLGLSKKMFPSEEECDPKSESIFAPSKVKEEINKIRNSVTGIETNEMNDKCYFEKPFGKVLSKNALSSIEGIIKATIRTRIIEEFVKSIPIASCLKISRSNYDLSNIDYIVQKLIIELKTVNPWGPREIEKENYYLLFLEQAVQAFERRKINKLPKIVDPETGIEQDEFDFSSLGENIKNAYETIKLFRDNFSYENSIVENKVDTVLLKNRQKDSTLLADEDFSGLASLFQKLGNRVFTSENDFTFNKSIFQGKRATNLFSVLFAIKLCEKECLEILKQVVFDEYEQIVEEFHKNHNPEITDLSKFLLTNTEIFENNRIQNFGTFSYDQNDSIGSYNSIGEAEDIVDVVESSPFADTATVKFKLEKYIRVVEKENHDNITLEAKELLENRDHNLRGVVKIENLENFFLENQDILGEYYISDLFGDAYLEPPPTEPPPTEPPPTEVPPTELPTAEVPPAEVAAFISGSISLKSGLRMVLNLPIEESDPDSILLTDLIKSKIEKAYFCNHSALDTSLSFSIPLDAIEIDLKEAKIKDLNISGDYDLDCLATKLVESDVFRDLFHKVIPIKAASSIALNYSNVFFLSSIGLDDGWTSKKMLKDETAKGDDPAGLLCRKYFACFYNSNRYVHSEFFKIPKLEFPDFMKLLFGGFQFPEINLNLILPIDFQFDHKIVKTNPFDKNGDSCSDK